MDTLVCWSDNPVVPSSVMAVMAHHAGEMQVTRFSDGSVTLCLRSPMGNWGPYTLGIEHAKFLVCALSDAFFMPPPQDKHPGYGDAHVQANAGDDAASGAPCEGEDE